MAVSSDDGTYQRLNPQTPVSMGLREFLALIIAIIAIVAGAATAWRSLESSDAQAASRIDVIEHRLANVATRADLRVLAADIRLCIVQPATCFELGNQTASERVSEAAANKVRQEDTK